MLLPLFLAIYLININLLIRRSLALDKVNNKRCNRLITELDVYGQTGFIGCLQNYNNYFNRSDLMRYNR